MAKFFQFSTRNVEIRFFDADPVTVTLTISDETDERFAEAAEFLREGTAAGSIEERRKLWIKAVDTLIGAENRAKILSRSTEQDTFAIAEIYSYVQKGYAAAKVKNLSASAR